MQAVYAACKRSRAPSPPGAAIERALQACDATQTQLARAMGIPLQRLHLVIRAKRRVTPDTALRLSRCLGRSPHHWLDLQSRFDLHRARTGISAADFAAMTPLASLTPDDPL